MLPRNSGIRSYCVTRCQYNPSLSSLLVTPLEDRDVLAKVSPPAVSVLGDVSAATKCPPCGEIELDFAAEVARRVLLKAKVAEASTLPLRHTTSPKLEPRTADFEFSYPTSPLHEELVHDQSQHEQVSSVMQQELRCETLNKPDSLTKFGQNNGLTDGIKCRKDITNLKPNSTHKPHQNQSQLGGRNNRRSGTRSVDKTMNWWNISVGGLLAELASPLSLVEFREGRHKYQCDKEPEKTQADRQRRKSVVHTDAALLSRGWYGRRDGCRCPRWRTETWHPQGDVISPSYPSPRKPPRAGS
ncbi:hypothetical protein PR048_006213 [Dryococelus australis]|uniref:Uncharacterized protein n=1 Tax=Dryococelus australis TaxID=614101 RepID=A0ABQ9IAB3_9NEOP|nr:hypothetical protein PR048_006213 [Dryococelus australis]